MSDILDNPPDFVRTELQISYYRNTYHVLVKNDVPLKEQDKFSLGMLAVNLAMVDYCIADIEKNGTMMEVQGDRNVISRKNPSTDLLKEAQTAVRYYFKEFQMSPNSRVSNGLTVPNPGASKDDEFDKV